MTATGLEPRTTQFLNHLVIVQRLGLHNHLLLVLMKLKLGLYNHDLGIRFGINDAFASKIFRTVYSAGKIYAEPAE